MTDKHRIYYFDNNATTRVAPEVVAAMLPFLSESYGNPSSAYTFGKNVAHDVKLARDKVAALIHADPREIIFTSCGTESDNAAIWSALQTSGKRHIVTTQVEHSAIMNQTDQLERMGYVERRPNPHDRRSRLVFLTERGASVRPVTHATAARVEEQWAQLTSAEELEALRGSLLHLLTELRAQ